MIRRIAIVAACAVASAATAAYAAGGTTKPSTETLKLSGPLTGGSLDDVAPAGTSIGDVVTFTQDLKAGGKQVGRVAASCTRTQIGAKPESLCTGVYILRDGEIFIQGRDQEAVSGHPLGITGGSGRYAGVGGEVTVKHNAAGDAYTLRITR
jgi:hypothetical protein